MMRFSGSAALAALALISVFFVERFDLTDVLAQECDGQLVKQEEMIVTVELAPGVFGPAPILHGDLNADGGRDLSDAVYLLQHLFLGGPEPAPLVAVECVPDGGGDACVRFYNNLLCSGMPFEASLTVCGNEFLSTSGAWSDCICIEDGPCSIRAYANTGCGEIDISGSLPLEAGNVYSFVLQVNASQQLELGFLDDVGDCSVPPPEGKGLRAVLTDELAVILGRMAADEEISSLR